MTAKQKLFIEEYLIDLNATQAAIRAGYSPDSARQSGADNMKNPYISARIEQAMAERSRRTGISQERVIRELARLAFVNPTDVINMKDATLKESSNTDDTAAIQSVKVKSFGEDGIEREIKMADKLRALELLGKHLGMFQNNLNVNVQSSEKLDAIMSQLGGEGLVE